MNTGPDHDIAETLGIPPEQLRKEMDEAAAERLRCPVRACGVRITQCLLPGGHTGDHRFVIAPMASAHTPGPWTLRVGASYGIEVRAENDPGNQFYCTVSLGWGPDAIKTCRANACLIAAAPELLTVLEDLVEAIWSGRIETEGVETFTNPAREIIAKARGERNDDDE